MPTIDFSPPPIGWNDPKPKVAKKRTAKTDLTYMSLESTPEREHFLKELGSGRIKGVYFHPVSKVPKEKKSRKRRKS